LAVLKRDTDMHKLIVFGYLLSFLLAISVASKEKTISQTEAQPLGISSRSENTITLRSFANGKKKFSKADASNSDYIRNAKKGKTEDLKPKSSFTMKGQLKHGAMPLEIRGRVPCGDYNSGLFFDRCGVCGGDDACVDCFNVTFGKAKLDRCDVCDGSNECIGCDDIAYIDNPQDKPEYDICGKCGGDGSSCRDCEGVPNGGKVYDACGNCGGDGSECCGLNGECSGHGSCDSSLKGCRCDVGWTGLTCQAKQNMCQLGGLKEACNGRGQCNQDTGTCICDEGWYGDQCHLKTCSGHGPYDPETNTCICAPGYTGEDCSMCENPPSGWAYLCMQKYRILANGKVAMEGNTISILDDIDAAQNQQFIDNGEWGDNVLKNVDDASSLSKEALESIVQPMMNKRNKFIIDFKRIAVEETDVAIHVMGMSMLARKIPGIMILPGSSVNGTVYGCNCRPATPVDDGQIYDVVDTQDKSDSGKSTNNGKDKTSSKSIIQMEKDAYDRLWGKNKDNKEEKSGTDEESPGYNSLTIVKQRQRKEDIERPVFNEKQRVQYGAYTPDMKLIAHGRFFTRFVEKRVPLDGMSARSQQQELVDMYKKDIMAARNEPMVMGITLRSMSSTDTDTTSAVTTVIVIASVLASVLITMLGTACIFISKRNFEGYA